MRYQVPQFIEVEDKIFGPLTLKQFLYVGGGLGLGFIIWSLIDIKIIAVIVALPVVIFFFALAFYKVNNKPFSFMIESAFKFFVSNKLYIWKKEKKPIEKKREEVTHEELFVPRLSDSKLRELTWGLDINEKLASEQMESKANQSRFNIKSRDRE